MFNNREGDRHMQRRYDSRLLRSDFGGEHAEWFVESNAVNGQCVPGAYQCFYDLHHAVNAVHPYPEQ
jgi:hypothetical protein